MSKSLGSTLIAALVLSLLALPAVAQDLVDVQSAGNGLSFTPNQATGFVLTVSAPDGTVFRYEFAAGEIPALDTSAFADGAYVWELSPIAEARTRDEAAPAQSPRRLQSGSFSIVGGGLVARGEESTADKSGDSGGPLNKDQLINDDLIVTQSACIGQDCVNGESFGFDTIRLKENNLRIKFQDTSNSASFPSNDWQLAANDTTNGGANKFSIDDIDGGRTPFTVEASAPSHSLYVDDGGRIGLGTATPVVELHMPSGDTPTLRLEQDGTSGFTPQIWDVAGNETNFFVRDATNGSRLPFKIVPAAPTNSLYVDSDGDIGLGTATPDAHLHSIGPALIDATDAGGTSSTALLNVRDTSGGNAQMVIDNTGSASALRNVIELTNPGATRILFNNTDSSNFWANAQAGDSFTISQNATGDAEMEITNATAAGNTAKVIFRNGTTATLGVLQTDGDLNLLGVVGSLSDRNAKTNFEPVDGRDVLARVADLPLSTWTYKHNLDSRHMGPMAQDFHAAFGLDEDETRIALNDLSGVALAAIQGLNIELEEKDEQIDQLEARNSDLEARLAALEAMVEAIANSSK